VSQARYRPRPADPQKPSSTNNLKIHISLDRYLNSGKTTHESQTAYIQEFPPKFLYSFAKLRGNKTPAQHFKKKKSPTMSTRPSNIGIKAIEVYFPSQVRFYSAKRILTHSSVCILFAYTDISHSVSTRQSLRSSMASLKANTQLASARQR
jgi:hypothetical protein